ncbi:unknown [Bacteroides sp. CAG:702]|nr:unknown [Bacteroides sp. CAG:702]
MSCFADKEKHCTFILLCPILLFTKCKSIKNAGIKTVHSIFLTIFELRYLLKNYH